MDEHAKVGGGENTSPHRAHGRHRHPIGSNHPFNSFLPSAFVRLLRSPVRKCPGSCDCCGDTGIRQGTTADIVWAGVACPRLSCTTRVAIVYQGGDEFFSSRSVSSRNQQSRTLLDTAGAPRVLSLAPLSSWKRTSARANTLFKEGSSGDLSNNSRSCLRINSLMFCDDVFLSYQCTNLDPTALTTSSVTSGDSSLMSMAKRMASKPSLMGMIKSSVTKCGRSCRNILSAAVGFSASCTFHPLVSSSCEGTREPRNYLRLRARWVTLSYLLRPPSRMTFVGRMWLARPIPFE
jgi:hypothetical protein